MVSFCQLCSRLLSKCLCSACIAQSALFLNLEMLQCQAQRHSVLDQEQEGESWMLLPECKNNLKNAPANCQCLFFLFYGAQSRILLRTKESAQVSICLQAFFSVLQLAFLMC